MAKTVTRFVTAAQSHALSRPGAIASMPRISAEFERSGSESCPEFFSGGREALEKEAISL
jgi:hypothetical protein